MTIFRETPAGVRTGSAWDTWHKAGFEFGAKIKEPFRSMDIKVAANAYAAPRDGLQKSLIEGVFELGAVQAIRRRSAEHSPQAHHVAIYGGGIVGVAASELDARRMASPKGPAMNVDFYDAEDGPGVVGYTPDGRGVWIIDPFRPQEPVCARCGSRHVIASAGASWDPGAQVWEIEDVSENSATCLDCEGECDLAWRDVAPA